VKILTAAEMQRIDRLTTERYSVPSLQLMENAGRGVVEFLTERFAPLEKHSITILCGRGNNGGDGMVAARLLRERGLSPRVLLLAASTSLKGDAAEQYKRLAHFETPETVTDVAAWQRIRSLLTGTTLVVDAILGTGLSKPLEGFYLEVIRDFPHAFPQARIVAVDLPSGVSADSGDLIGEAVRAHSTVTFTVPKYAHVFPPASAYSGEWVVKQIGTPLAALEGDPELKLNLTTREDVDWVARPRSLESHKGNFGHVLVLAGSLGKSGAAAMTGKAALRCGAGLVTVATSKSAQPAVASFALELMTEPLAETRSGAVSMHALDKGRMDKIVEGKSVLAVGPGLGTANETSQLVRTVVNQYNTPLVLDADGLNAFAGCANTLRAKGRIRVLTPHPGEMARLAGLKTAKVVENRVEVARDFACKHSLHLVLKGYRTVTAAPDGQVWVNPTGNPGMATAGSGDVLTGVIAGMLAQFPDRPATEVVAAAVYLHGLAGDVAAREKGEASLIAGDILEALPAAFLSLAGLARG
jgi:ADP-dependent NAD(P)H-hydrate dehydratase / NAD(P)H-hydrate epimerase